MTKGIITVLKIFIAIALIWFVSTKIDFTKVLQLYQKANKWYFIATAVLYAISQVIASARLNFFFHWINLPLTQWSNFKIFWLGLFYNLMPGGVGGDAYKVVVLKNKFNVKAKKITEAVLFDRLVGLVALIAIIGVMVVGEKTAVSNLLASFLPEVMAHFITTMIPIASLVFLIICYYGAKLLFKKLHKAYWQGLLYSIVAQIILLLAAICIIYAISDASHLYDYCFIFLIASIASLAGFGAREWVFFQGARWFLLDKELSISISLTFTIVVVFMTIFGVIYQFKQMNLSLEEVSE